MGPADRDLIRRIASVVGHELRNPLAVINNSAYFVRAKLGGGLDPKVAKHLKIIEAEIARADGLISDIVSYSRPLEPQIEALELDRAVAGWVKAYAAPQGAKAEFKPGAKGARIKADPKLLESALRRLLDNAFSAMGGKGAAKVATKAAGGKAVISVTDAGPGLDPKIKDALYEPFVTSKPRGLGLGLSLARKALEAHRGSVEHESGPKGCAFRLALPLA